MGLIIIFAFFAGLFVTRLTFNNQTPAKLPEVQLNKIDNRIISI